MKWAALALASWALLTAACDPASPGSESHLKIGLVRSTCGPADGAATDITLGDSAMECGGFRAADHTYDGMIQNDWMGGLKPGMEYRNIPLLSCGAAECWNGSDTLDIRFSDTAGADMRGTYRIRSGAETRESGNFELKKCHDKLFCG